MSYNLETNRIENKEQLNDDFEQEVIAFLNYREGGAIYIGIKKNGQVIGVQDVDLVEQLGSGMERIMSVYDKSIFEFLPNFLRINFYFDKEVLEYL